MKPSLNKSQIQCYLNIPLTQNIPTEHYLKLNRDIKHISIDSMQSVRKEYSFSNLHTDDTSFTEVLSSYINTTLLNDLRNGYDNAIILLFDDYTHSNDLLTHIMHSTLSNLLSLKTSLEDSYLDCIACGAIIITNDSNGEQCLDLLSKGDISIKSIENSKEILIEGLSYQNVNSLNEGDDFAKSMIDNRRTYYKERGSTSDNTTMCMRLLTLFKSKNGDNIVNAYISKLDIILLPFNSKVNSEESISEHEDIAQCHMNSLSVIAKSIHNKDKDHHININNNKAIDVLLNDYFLGSNKTTVITSIKDILSLSKYKAESLFDMIHILESIETHPIPKQDTLANLILFKSLYTQSCAKRSKDESKDSLNEMNTSNSSSLISHIKDLLNHQYSMIQTLRRLPFISYEILNSITKYKEDCESYCKDNYTKANEIKDSLLSLIQSIEPFGSNNSNGQELIDVIKAKLDETITLLTKLSFSPNHSLNPKLNEQDITIIQSEAYWSLLKYYSIKDSSNSNSNKEGDEGVNSQDIKDLIHCLIELNEKIYNTLLKDKVIDSYEVIGKEEYVNLIKQLNELKYHSQSESLESKVIQYANQIEASNKEIEQLKQIISTNKLNTKNKQFDLKSIKQCKQRELCIEYIARHKDKSKSKSKSKGKISCIPKMDKEKALINRPITIASFSILSASSSFVYSNKVIPKQYKSSIQVTKKKDIDITPRYTSNTRCNSRTKNTKQNNNNTNTNTNTQCFIITKGISFSYTQSLVKGHQKNTSTSISNSTSTGRLPNNTFKNLKVMMTINTIEYVAQSKMEDNTLLILQNKINDQMKEIRNLKGLNELILKQKDSEISSYSAQLKYNKQRITSLEGEINEFKQQLSKKANSNTNQHTASQSMIISPIVQRKQIKDSYSAQKDNYASNNNNNNNKHKILSPSASSASIDFSSPKDIRQCKKIKSQRDLKEISQLTHNSMKISESNTKSNLLNCHCSERLSQSTMKIIKEIQKDNEMLLKEIGGLRDKNIELSNKIKILSRREGGRGESSSFIHVDIRSRSNQKKKQLISVTNAEVNMREKRRSDYNINKK